MGASHLVKTKRTLTDELPTALLFSSGFRVNYRVCPSWDAASITPPHYLSPSYSPSPSPSPSYLNTTTTTTTTTTITKTRTSSQTSQTCQGPTRSLICLATIRTIIGRIITRTSSPSYLNMTSRMRSTVSRASSVSSSGSEAHRSDGGEN